MKEQPNDLWRGGPWEQPSPSFPTPPPVVVPARRPPVLRVRRRRRTLLRCTEKACPIIVQGRALQEEFGARLLAHTNEAQRKAFFETMDIINENLDAILEGEA